MTQKQKRVLLRIIISAVLYAICLFLQRFIPGYIFILPYAVIGYDIIYKAFRSIKNGQVFNENFLMTVATVAAFCIGEYSEAVAVMLFYQVGELFQSYAVGKSRRSISGLMDLIPEYANIEENGLLIRTDPECIEVGTEIIVKPGERIPIDGVVTEGESYLDTSALTGESMPKAVSVGDGVFSGCINSSGTLRIRTTKAFEDSTVARITELVENASSRKAKTENFIPRFARIYTPVVTLCAVLLAIVPPLFLGGWGDWIKRACVFLVISCPCALVISVPLGFFGGIGAASRLGVLVKGSNFLEMLTGLNTVAFDKTGTLTKGEFSVTEIIPNGLSEDELLRLAAYAEAYSDHPVAAAVRKAYGKPIPADGVSNTNETAGQGVSCTIDGRRILAGNEKLMRAEGVAFTKAGTFGTAVYVARDGVFVGSIVISDTVKEGALEAVESLKAAGVKSCVMLSGDRREAAEKVAELTGIDKVYAELLPSEKVSLVEEMINKEEKGEHLGFVGDGINDAPVLSRADIGIAMGTLGSDAAIEAADIVIMDDNIGKIAPTVKIARKTVRIVKQNIFFALAVKLAVLILGALGGANMWAAVAADVGVAILAILNSMRTLV